MSAKAMTTPVCRTTAAEQGYTAHIKARGEEKVVEDGEVKYPARRWVVEAWEVPSCPRQPPIAG